MVAEQVGPLLVIVGETASGKSSLAMDLARQLDGEIICADSWTVYKDFDIGTAKPTRLERAQIPHHLLDVADARGGFNAVVFQQLAGAAIQGIHRRGRLPILVGGTGLYIDSILYGYQFPSAPPKGMREELDALSLSDLLAKATAQGFDLGAVDTRNKRRVIRLIENEGQLPTKQSLRANTLILGLQTPREVLRERAEQRVDAMLAAGLEKETQRLADEYGWGAEPMKGIGYQQWRSYFEGTQSLEETRQKIIKATMDLAKRQRTWFKRNKSIHWIENRGDLQQIVELITTKLHKL